MIVETSVADLAGAARAIARAESPADVFKTLLEGSRIAAPRIGVFLVRRGELQGWGSVGYAADTAGAQRSWRGPLDRGWPGDVVRDEDGGPVPRPADAAGPDFGQDPAADAAGLALRIDGKPVALVVGERSAGEEPWQPEALALLVDVARLRLEVNLARRRAAGPEAASSRPAAEREASKGPAPQSPAAEAHLPPAKLEPARRYARLVATDIRLYNEEAVALGRRNSDLAERIGEHLERGKSTFVRRHGELGPEGLQLLREAYVEVLGGGDATLIPESLFQ